MGLLHTSPPPPHATEVRRWALSTGAELRGLRASLHEAFTGHALAEKEELDGIPERVVLVATELATNALLHGLPPTTVRLLRDEDVFILDVTDHDLTTVPELADTCPLGAGGRGGRVAPGLLPGGRLVRHGGHEAHLGVLPPRGGSGRRAVS